MNNSSPSAYLHITGGGSVTNKDGNQRALDKGNNNINHKDT